MKKKVSIIIPCHNAHPYLVATLESAINQSYFFNEIIVVDDGSTDGSYEYVKSLNQPNVILKRNERKGACAARNDGLELATGDYIQFLDADDLLSADKIEKQVELLEQYPNRVAVCSTVHFYADPNNGKIVDKDFMFNTAQPEDFLLKLYGGDGLHHNMVQTSAWLTPKHIINKAGLWDETLSKDQDGEYFCRVVMASQGICYTPEVLNYYRKHIRATSVSSGNNITHFESRLKALKSKELQLFKYFAEERYKNAFALQYKLLAINAYPDFNNISKIALEYSNQLGGSNYLPILGGKIVESTKVLFGWRIAKLIKNAYNKLFN